MLGAWQMPDISSRPSWVSGKLQAGRGGAALGRIRHGGVSWAVRMLVVVWPAKQDWWGFDSASACLS
jgi:hypothetical protein